MKSLSALLLAMTASVAFAVPVALEKRCYVGPPNDDIIDRIYATALSRGVNSKVMLAMFECAAVESNYNNLNCGDQDSLGVFQQRPSMGWGTIAQLLDVNYATNKFLDGAISKNAEQPGLTAGQLAQAVQISEFPTRYDESESKARQYLNEAISRKGGSSSSNGGSANVGTAPSSSSGSSSGSGSSSSGSSSSSSGSCSKTYKVASGDTCSKLANAGGISLSTFYSLNKNVNSSCSNLQVGTSYCVKAGSTSSATSGSSSGTSKATVPSNLASGTTKTCKTYYTVAKGNTCGTLTGKGGLALAKLRTLNTGINSGCTNLVIGKAYCVAA